MLVSVSCTVVSPLFSLCYCLQSLLDSRSHKQGFFVATPSKSLIRTTLPSDTSPWQISCKQLTNKAAEHLIKREWLSEERNHMKEVLCICTRAPLLDVTRRCQNTHPHANMTARLWCTAGARRNIMSPNVKVLMLPTRGWTSWPKEFQQLKWNQFSVENRLLAIGKGTTGARILELMWGGGMVKVIYLFF